MNKIYFWIIRHLPIPPMLRLRLDQRATNRLFRRLIAKARISANSEEIDNLRSEQNYELSVLEEEYDELLTNHLMKKARGLKVRTPEFTGLENDSWKQGAHIYSWHLNIEGISKIRAAIREEIKWRQEQRSYWLAWLSGFVGLIGALIGLVAIYKK